MKRILIVVQHRLYREQMHNQFQPCSSEFILEFVNTIAAAQQKINQQLPDLLLVSSSLLDTTDCTLLPDSIHMAQYPVIVIGNHDDEQRFVGAHESGVMDYWVIADSALPNMVRAARRTLREWDNIIQRRIAEHKLQQSEMTLQRMLATVTQGFILVQRDSTIQFVNPYVETAFGYSSDELIGQSIDMLLPVMYRHKHQYLRETYMKHPTPRAIGIGRDLLAQRKDGSTFPVEVSLAPVEMAEEAFVMCMVVDITERIKTQEALRKSEERFRSLVNAMDDIIYTLDKQQRHTGVYGRWVENSGLTPENFLGRTSSEIFGSAAGQVHKDANERALDGESVVYDWSGYIGEEHRYYQTRVSPMFDNKGQVTGIVGIGRDITELVTAKQQLEIHNNQLEALVEERTANLDHANQLLIEQVNERELSEARERDQRVLLESIHEIALSVNSSLRLDEILDGIGASLHKVVPHNVMQIILVNDSGMGQMVRSVGFTDELESVLPQGEFNIYEKLLLPHIVTAGQPVILDTMMRVPAWQDTPRRILQACLGTPILGDAKKLLGFILLFSYQPDFFNERDVARLNVLVNHIAVAIHNAQLYEQAGQLAIMKDRQRLARDLHDAVTQTLFSAGMISDSLIRLWETHPDKVKARLIHLNQLMQGALTEMRTLLIELRPQAIAATDFDDLVHHQLVSFYNRTGIMPQYTVVGTAEHSLASNVKEVLYRILQEALSNIIKHALAANVEITLTYEPDGVRLRIRDDGYGFDSQQTRVGTHLGLRIMNERAESIGASLTITSVPGSGTRILVHWKSKD